MCSNISCSRETIRHRILEAMGLENKPDVICVIVNWNGWIDTIKCLESLNQSDYDNLTPLLVDNGSVDDSVARIRDAFPDLEIIQSAMNLGFGAGNNLGIRSALKRGAKYIWLLNNDTIVKPDTLAALVATAEGDASLGMVGSVLHYMKTPDQVQAWGGGSVNLWMGTSHHFHGPVACSRLDYLTAASVLIHTKVLEQIGLFDERYFMYWEDTDLCFRIRRAGWNLGVAERAILLHKEGGSTRKRSALFDAHVTTSGVLFLRKYSAYSLVSVSIFVGGRALNRILHGNIAGFAAILRAYCAS